MFVGACFAVAAGAAPGAAPGIAPGTAPGTAVGAGFAVGSAAVAGAVGTAVPSLGGWQGMPLLRWQCVALVRLLSRTTLPLGEHHGHGLHLLQLLLAVLLMLLMPLNVAIRESYLYPSQLAANGFLG